MQSLIEKIKKCCKGVKLFVSDKNKEMNDNFLNEGTAVVTDLGINVTQVIFMSYDLKKIRDFMKNLNIVSTIMNQFYNNKIVYYIIFFET